MTIDQVYEDIHAFVGRPVVMTGEVVAVLTSQTFTFRDETDAGSRVMLVVSAGEGSDPELAAGDFVWVQGVIRDFDIEEIEEFDDLDLAAALLEQFNDDPALIAESVMSESFSVDAIVSAAEAFVGRNVRVTTPVGQVLGPQALTLTSEGGFLGFGQESLLVVHPAGLVSGPLDESTVVTVEGTVRMLHLDEPGGLHDDFPFLSRDIVYELFDGQLVLVADDITVVDPASTSQSP